MMGEKDAISAQRRVKFLGIAGILILAFTAHNYLQELIMSIPGITLVSLISNLDLEFQYGIVLGYLEVLGVTVFTFCERKYKNETTRKAPWSAYMTLCICLFISSAASNMSLDYINYPTKVVFRSCKLVPTIVIAMFMNQKKVYKYDLIFGIMISLGMVLFAFADMTVYPDANALGLILVSVSVIADAFLPNFQERVFSCGSSRSEVTYYTNIFSLVVMSIVFTGTGDMSGAIVAASHNSTLLFLMIIYTIISYVAISVHMTMIKEFGGIATVIIGNARKAMTIVLSFILFPKPGSIYYLLGGALVFGGLTLNAYSKEMGWGKEKLKPIPTPPVSKQYMELATVPPEDDDMEKKENNQRIDHP